MSAVVVRRSEWLLVEVRVLKRTTRKRRGVGERVMSARVSKAAVRKKRESVRWWWRSQQVLMVVDRERKRWCGMSVVLSSLAAAWETNGGAGGHGSQGVDKGGQKGEAAIYRFGNGGDSGWVVVRVLVNVLMMAVRRRDVGDGVLFRALMVVVEGEC
ncbi:hypothetical protein B0T24DRAFT_615780 [Lasiosphaeria ovina]|uniref:Uncharacterized protein n=1 Tax=Lasiosphaeria ovina TaxID=92902 RepID=A0AAE0TUZ7_9PEZI|nr:hypothetical protein B0T24DRAFT_615780 [Lasiosphaeria ovina]